MSPLVAIVPGPSSWAQNPGDRVELIGFGGVGGVVVLMAAGHRHSRFPNAWVPPLGVPVVVHPLVAVGPHHPRLVSYPTRHGRFTGAEPGGMLVPLWKFGTSLE